MDSVGLLDLLERCLRDPEAHCLACLHDLLHRSPGLLDGYRGVHPVQIVQVDVVGSEPTQGTVYCFSDALWAAIRTSLHVLIEHDPRLGREHYPLAQVTLGEGAPDQLFVFVRAIDLGGVYQDGSELDCPVDNADRFFIVTLARILKRRHAHAPQPNCPDLRAIGAQPALPHVPRSFVLVPLAPNNPR